jgi:hypothetical protein
MTTKKTQFSPKKSHYMTFNQAVAAPTISLYGRLIEDGAAKPSDLGIFHPSDRDEFLHRSVVFGYATGDQCKMLATPQQVWLPFPDGPADGCNWDPAQYVVWKNVQPDWKTIHVVSQRKPLSLALAAGEKPQTLEASEAPSPTQVIFLIQTWAALPAPPKYEDVLSALWSLYRRTDFTSFGAPALAQTLTRNGADILPQSITTTMTVQGPLDVLA